MISDQEKMQIRQVVDQVVEARLIEFSEIQLQLIRDMLLTMTDKYVEALMQLATPIARMCGMPDGAIQKEAERAAELMIEGLKRK